MELNSHGFRIIVNRYGLGGSNRHGLLQHLRDFNECFMHIVWAGIRAVEILGGFGL